MADIISVLLGKEGFVHLNGATEEQIEAAQESLQLSFNEEYLDYNRKYGPVSFLVHELTGICSLKRLNVVDVTNNARTLIHNIPKDWYVVEEIYMDDVFICQNSAGTIFQIAPYVEPIQIANSICEYIDS